MFFWRDVGSREHLCQVLIMWRVLRQKGSEVQDHWDWHSLAIFNFVRYRRVFAAIIQSAAIYSVASISLLVTTLISPNIGFYACLSVFPPLIVRLSYFHLDRYLADVAPPPLGSGILADRDSGWTQICNLAQRLLAGVRISYPIIYSRRRRMLKRRPTRLLIAANVRFEDVTAVVVPGGHCAALGWSSHRGYRNVVCRRCHNLTVFSEV